MTCIYLSVDRISMLRFQCSYSKALIDNKNKVSIITNIQMVFRRWKTNNLMLEHKIIVPKLSQSQTYVV